MFSFGRFLKPLLFKPQFIFLITSFITLVFSSITNVLASQEDIEALFQERWSVDSYDGSTLGTLNDILETDDGYIYALSSSNLYRFDLYGNEVPLKYTTAISKCDRNLSKIIETRDNNLIIISSGLTSSTILKSTKEGDYIKSTVAGLIDFKSIIEDSEGNYLVLGYDDTEPAYYVYRYNSDCSLMWVKKMSYDIGEIVAGDNMFVGIAKDKADSSSKYSKVIKWDLNGDNEYIIRDYSSATNYVYSFYNIVCSNAGILVVGYMENVPTMDEEGYLLLLNSSKGNVIWENTYNEWENQTGIFPSSQRSFKNAIDMPNGNFLVFEQYSTLSHEINKNNGKIISSKVLASLYYSKIITTSDDGVLIIITRDSKSTIVKYGGEEVDALELAVATAESTPTRENINNARILINDMSESARKDQLQARLNTLIASDLSLTPENITSNIDIFISSGNSLSLSLVNTSITFDDFSGVEDLSLDNALSFLVSSSLEYNITTLLEGNIVSSNGNSMDKSILNLRKNGDTTYKNYSSTSSLDLFGKQSAGNNINHKIDIMLKGNIAHTADVYNAVLKISVEQA